MVPGDGVGSATKAGDGVGSATMVGHGVSSAPKVGDGVTVETMGVGEDLNSYTCESSEGQSVRTGNNGISRSASNAGRSDRRPNLFTLDYVDENPAIRLRPPHLDRIRSAAEVIRVADAQVVA